MRFRFAIYYFSLVLISCDPNNQDSAATGPSPPGPSAPLVTSAPEGPWSTAEFTPPSEAVIAEPFNGVLRIESGNGAHGLEVLKDLYAVMAVPDLNISELPPFEIQLVSDGEMLVPVLQTPQRSEHPYWELVPGAGASWKTGDEGNWNRASLSFSLKEKNQNCIHNGLMTFAYQAGGGISEVAWQISSETCSYFQFNLWGRNAAQYGPQEHPQATELLRARSSLLSQRLPTKPLSALTEDYPGLKLETVLPDPDTDMDLHGFLVDGVHYRSSCRTRQGDYPFCDDLVIPSYSLAKSIFAGLYYLHVIREWPEFSSISVTDLIPECRLNDERWHDVTMSDLINMTTGNYESDKSGNDEAAESMQEFFLAETHPEKIKFSCEAWQRQVDPGLLFVYHTTDDYLLGTAINAFVQKKLGHSTDFYSEILYPRLLEPLDLSPLLQWTQRTYDEVAQPFTAYGMVMHSDDIVRISDFLVSTDEKQQLFDQEGFEQAMFRNPMANPTFPGSRGLLYAYSQGFWGVNAAEFLNCSEDAWIPYMSGFGGISVVLLPNQTVYYRISDSGVHRFLDAVTELEKIESICSIN
jgi:hypothetical protein